MSSHTETVLDSIQVAANSSVPSDPVFLEDQLSEAIIYVTNNGASTNLVVSCYSSPDGITKAPLQPFNLDTTDRTSHLTLDVVPKALFFTAYNYDPANPTDYTVKITKKA